ncbi:BBE domain-containing protein [Micromonospora sp. NPDC005206]|uniref:BBE domain-containing protein n=1 Tax=Micromonospora sp. NPDC005206 TaxID=3157022 RepID=UPI0033AFEE0A
MAVGGPAAGAGRPAGRPGRPAAVRGRVADVRRRDGRRQPLPAADPLAARAHRCRGGRAGRRRPAGQLAVLRAGPAPLPRRGQPGAARRHGVRPAGRSPVDRGDRRLGAGRGVRAAPGVGRAHLGGARARPARWLPEPARPEETDRLRLAYGANWARLLRAKRRYDPRDLLTAVPTLPPPEHSG